MTGNDPLAKMGVLFGLEDGPWQKGLKSVEKSLGRFSYKTQRMGKKLQRNLSVPLTIMSGVAVRSFDNFDQAMTNSLSIMDNVGPQMQKRMEETALQIGKTTKIGATQAAEAYFYLASAGYDARKSIEAMPAVAAFAQAGNFDMALATDLATDAQSALGLAVSNTTQNQKNLIRVTDVLVKANTLANASVEQFSKSLTNKAGTALKITNKSMEEGVAVLAAYADQGVKAERAGEAFNMVLRDLQKAAIENADAFKENNITVFDNQDNLENMANIIGDMEKRFVGMSDKQKKSTLAMLGFQERSQAALLTLLGTSESIRRYQGELEKAAGTTDKVAKKQMESRTSLDKMKQSLEVASISLGRAFAPMVQKAAEFVKDLADQFSGLTRESQTMVAKIIAITIAIGPTLLIIGKLVGAMKVLVATRGGLLLLVKAFKAIKAAVIAPMALVALKIVAVVAAVGSLVAAGYYLYDNWGAIMDRLSALWSTFKNFMIDGIVQIVDLLYGKLFSLFGMDVTGPVRESLAKFKDEIPNTQDMKQFKSFGDTFGPVWEGMKGKVDETIGSLKGFLGLSSKVTAPKIGKATVESPNLAIGSLTIPALDLSQFKVSIKEVERISESVPRLFRTMEVEISDVLKTLAYGFQDFATAALESTLAAAVAGDNVKVAFLSVLTSLADLAIRVGKIAIGIGLAVEGIKKALQTLNPAAAIAAGIGLIALGAVAKGALQRSISNEQSKDQPKIPRLAAGAVVSGRSIVEVAEYPGARNNPEVIAPLDKLKNMIGDTRGAGSGFSGEVEFVIRNKTLRGFLRETGRSNKKLNGRVTEVKI